MKKLIFLLISSLQIFTSAFADDIPYRQQMREIYRQLPIAQDNIVFLGNSITDFGLWSEFFGDNPNIVGRGIQGIESAEVLEHLSLIGSGHPRKLFLMIGINDFEHPQTVVPNIRKMIETMRRESPETELYVQSILPCNLAVRANVPPTLNPEIQALCAEMGVTYVDIYEAMTQITGNTSMPANMTDDSLHPNILGYRTWVNLVAPYVGGTSAINATKTTYSKPLSRNIYKSILSEYQYLPVSEKDYLHVGDYQVMTGEWGELMGTPHFKNRGLGGGYGWSMTLPEFNSAYTSFITGTPRAIFFQCGKRQLDDKPTDISTIVSQYRTAVQNMRAVAPSADIYLESIIPNADASVNTTSIIPFNQKIREIVEADATGKLHFIDVYAALEENGVLAPRYQGANTVQSRGINGRGYVRWAKTLAPYVIGAQPQREMTDAQAQLNDAMYDALNMVWNMPSDPSLDVLRSKAEEARDAVQSATASEAKCKELTAAIMTIIKEQARPKVSTNKANIYYTISTPNRGSRYATSQGAGQDMMGNTTATEASYWRLVQRTDGKFDIQNYADHTYVSPSSNSNTALKTQTSSPAKGWELKDSSQEGLYIIASGTVQWNQTNSPQNFRVYNWGGGSNGTDTGCQYKFTEVLRETLLDGLAPSVMSQKDETSPNVYDLQGRQLHSRAHGISLQSNRKVLH